MPSPGAAAAMQRAREAENNFNNNVGYIAVHPEKGIFLGVDRDSKETVFEAIEKLEPDQPVPVFFHFHFIPWQACPDTGILDCNAVKVAVSDRDREITRAKDIVDFENNTIKSREMLKPREDFRAVSVANMKIERAITFPRNKNRYYEMPQSPAV